MDNELTQEQWEEKVIKNNSYFFTMPDENKTIDFCIAHCCKEITYVDNAISKRVFKIEGLEKLKYARTSHNVPGN